MKKSAGKLTRRPPALPSPTEKAPARVLAWIERHIRANRLGEGDPLPGELAIAQATAAGRTTVREALVALKALGLIQSRRKGGIRIVRDPVLLELSPYFTQAITEPARRDEIMEFRAALEWGLVPLVLANAAESTIRALRSIIRDVAAAPPGRAELNVADARFHIAMTAGCGNRLATLLAHLYGPVFRYHDGEAYTPADIDGWVCEHESVVAALAARDEARFVEVMKRHMFPYMRLRRK